MTRKQLVRVLLTLVVTGGCLGYILWQLDVRQTVHILVHSNLAWFAGAVLVMLAGVPPMAYRWQKLLEARGIRERLGWLMRAYLVSYTAGQVLPTAVGGDASRVYETARRHPGRLGDLTAIVLLERALGGVATLVLAAVGLHSPSGTTTSGPMSGSRAPSSSVPSCSACCSSRTAHAVRCAGSFLCSGGCESSVLCARSTKACTSSGDTSG